MNKSYLCHDGFSHLKKNSNAQLEKNSVFFFSNCHCNEKVVRKALVNMRTFSLLRLVKEMFVRACAQVVETETNYMYFSCPMLLLLRLSDLQNVQVRRSWIRMDQCGK